MRLVIDQADRLAEASLPQRSRKLKARVAGADDNRRHGAFGHDPMSRPRPIWHAWLAGALASHPSHVSPIGPVLSGRTVARGLSPVRHLRFKWPATIKRIGRDSNVRARFQPTPNPHCSRSTARSPPSRSTGPRPSTRSISRSPESWSSSAPRSRPIRQHQGAGARRAKAAPSAPAAICRPSARPRPPTPSRPSSASCSSTIMPSSRRVRRMPKIVLSSVHGSAAGAGMGARLRRRSLHRRRGRPLHAGLCQDRRLAGWRQHRRHGRHRRRAPRAADLSGRGQFFRRSRPMNGAWSPRSFRRRN